MLRGFRYRLDPTVEQEQSFRQFAGVCRLVYNLALEQRSVWWRQFRRNTGSALDYVAQCRELTDLRAAFDWIGTVSATCEQQALRDLHKAFSNFFEGRCGYPTPRKKGTNDSFRFPGCAVETKKLNASWSAVRLPKIGWVRFRDTRPTRGVCKNATVSLGTLGWHISFACEFEESRPLDLTEEVGIDRGVSNTIALSTGELASVPSDTLRLLYRRCRNAQQATSRRKLGSARHAKARKRATACKAKAARVRKDWNHKVTATLATSFGTVCIEALNIQNMTASARGTIEEPGVNVSQKAGLNRAILEHGWYQFETFLTYKLAAAGGKLIKVDPRNTSRRCNECGSIDARSRESQARFKCVECGHEAHADVNAAKNILWAGTQPAARVKSSRASRQAKILSHRS